MNIVSVIVIGLALIGGLRGYKLGFGRVVLPSFGLIGGLLISSWVMPKVIGRVTPTDDKVLMAMIGIVLFSVIGFLIGEYAGQKLDSLSLRMHLERLNHLLGALFDFVVVLTIVWFLASSLSNVQAYGVGRQVQTSIVIRELNEIMPTPPALLSRIEKIISPNGFPNVFIGNEPERALLNPGQKLTPAQIAAAEQSVVQVLGWGCGGLVEGSGFVIANRAVVTNAHVVAGVSRPIIVDGGARYAARVIYFDSRTDAAVLRVDDLTAPALPFLHSTLPDGTTAAVLGYPGGGPLTAGDAVVLGQTEALGQDIYNRGSVNRSIYEIASTVEPGNSGGPLITSSGEVAGIVFAKSVVQPNVGYVLAADSIASTLERASLRSHTVQTGRCAAS